MSEENSTSITGLGDSNAASGTSRTGNSQPIEPSNPTTDSGLTVKPDSSGTPSSDSSSAQSNGDVVLYLPYPEDSFRYGQADEEVIVGREGKIFSRSEADSILESAERNNIQLLERGVGDLI